MATAMSDRTVAYYYDEEIGEGERRERGREPAMQARGETGGGDAAHTLHAPGPSQQLESAIRAIPRHSAAVGWDAEAGREGEAAACNSLFGGARPALTDTPMGAVRLPGSRPCLLALSFSKASAGGEGGGIWKGVGVEEDRGLFRPGRTGGRPTLEGERKRREGGRQHTPDGSQLSPPPLHPPPPQAPSTTVAATPCARTASA